MLSTMIEPKVNSLTAVSDSRSPFIYFLKKKKSFFHLEWQNVVDVVVIVSHLYFYSAFSKAAGSERRATSPIAAAYLSPSSMIH